MTEGMLKLEVAHRGRSGDLALELATIELLLEAQPGVPLTSTQSTPSPPISRSAPWTTAAASSTSATPTSPPSTCCAPTHGVSRVPIPDGDVDAKVDWGTPRTYFVVATSMPDASSQSPSVPTVTHLTDETLNPAVSTAEDRDHDISLTMEWAADVPSTSPHIPNDRDIRRRLRVRQHLGVEQCRTVGEARQVESQISKGARHRSP